MSITASKINASAIQSTLINFSGFAIPKVEDVYCTICKAKMGSILFHIDNKVYTEIFLGNKSIYLCGKCTKEQLNGIIVMDEI